MSDWIARYDDNWLLEWLGACPANVFGYTLPIRFSWSSDCGVAVVDGYGETGAAAFVLELENGFDVFHDWVTDIIPTKSGDEQRIARNDVPLQRIAGKAFLLDGAGRDMRTQLAIHAAQGARFLLGLQHEAISIVSISGLVLTVEAAELALCDWKNLGQRVIVDGTTAIIQAVTATTIELDVAVSGTEIMPAVPVYLEPSQSFPRYPVNAETWDIQARFALLDFAPPLAQLELGPLTDSAAFDDAIVISRDFSLIGNTLSFALNASGTGTGELVEADGEVQFNFEPDVTTLGDLRDALAGSVYVNLTGDYDPTDTIAAGDAFASTLLEGGAGIGDVGNGATVTRYANRPIWDREIAVTGQTIEDGIHARTRILHHGGIPYALAVADRADFYRAVVLTSGGRAEWQWLKKFIHTVQGCQKAWWLPTWRSDLTFVSRDTNEIVVEDDGNFSAWWPALRQHIQIVEDDGTITYAEISAAVKGGGEVTLTIDTSIASDDVSMISWIEPCRFESDTFQFKFNQRGVTLETVARVKLADETEYDEE